MKGHATIELTDVKTGEVQKIEEDNMVTNAIKYFCASAGRLASVYLPSDPLYAEMLGGLFVWDTQLEESVENVLPPAEAGVTAIGFRENANTGVSTQKVGSYNANESGVQIDGSVKMVYDFTTSQGNGEIACLTLTSKDGAISGYDYDLPNSYYRNGYPFSTGEVKLFNSNSLKTLKLDLSGDALYAFAGNNLNLASGQENQYCTYSGKLKIYKYELGIKKYRLNRMQSLTNVYTSFEIDLPQEIMNVYANKNARILYNVSDENIYLIFKLSSDIAANLTFHVLKIDKDFNVLSIFEMKNPLPETACDIWVSDSGYAYFKYSSGSMYKNYKVKLDDYTDVSFMFGSDVNRYYYFEQNGRIYGGSYSGSEKIPYINTAKSKAEYFNNAFSYLNKFYCKSENPLISLFYGSISAYNLNLARNNRYLATINNLATPVTKTPSQTMKITYILTFDDETETSSTT